MARRQRVDSIAAAVTVAAAADKQIDPPAHVPLAAGDMPFWASVIAEFARADWTAHQLEVAAMLARNMADAARNQNLLRSEGEVVLTASGTPTANPRLAALRMQTTNVLAFRRTLAIHARAQGGEARDVAKRKSQAKTVESQVRAGLDEFIARPTVQ